MKFCCKTPTHLMRRPRYNGSPSSRNARKLPVNNVRRFSSASACLLALLMAGCAGYRLGPTNGQVAGSRSVQINPFTNKTLEPRLGDYVTSSLRKNLQQDGTYHIDTHDDGDI